jgi:hypothetical protein
MEGGASEVDEDYLMVDDRPDGRAIVPVSVSARRPIDWVAHHLVGRGALVASGIYVGHADVLAALLYKYWPKLTHQLLQHVARSFAPGVENHLPPTLVQEALQAAPQTFWKHPPWMPLRALRVAHCGWSSLRSGRAIEQIVAPQQSPLSIKALPNTPLTAQPRSGSGSP